LGENDWGGIANRRRGEEEVEKYPEVKKKGERTPSATALEGETPKGKVFFSKRKLKTYRWRQYQKEWGANSKNV